MSAVQKTISPVDNSVYVERPYATPADIAATLKRAAAAQKEWRRLSLGERAKILTAFVDEFLKG